MNEKEEQNKILGMLVVNFEIKERKLDLYQNPVVI